MFSVTSAATISALAFKEIRVAIAGRGCDFEGHVQQLTHMRIEGGVIGNVPERGSHSRSIPTAYFTQARQFLGVDIDNAGVVRRTQFFDMLQRVAIDVDGQCQSIAASFAQANQLF